MPDDLGTKMLKARIRREAAARRDALDGRAERSATIAALVRGLSAYSAAQALHCYLAMRSEVDTRPLVASALAAGKAVAVPVIAAGGVIEHSWITSLAATDFGPGPLGTALPLIIRPALPGAWSLTIVPLLAFDRTGCRLGYGKGHYDRLLAQHASTAVGVAFACQEVAELPREPHDCPLDLIITEEGVIRPTSPYTSA